MRHHHSKRNPSGAIDLDRASRAGTSDQDGPDRLSPNRIKVFAGLLAGAITGVLLCLWMWRATHSVEVVQSIGMDRLARRWEEIMSILAMPMMLFFLLLGTWAASELWLSYRAMNDPNSYRRRRRITDDYR